MKLLRDKSLIRYIIVGLTTVLVDVGLLYLLVSQAGIEVYVAATISFWTSLAYNFLLSKLWTFGVKKHTTYQLIGYGLVITINYFVGLGLIGLAGDMHQSYLVGKLAALAITTIWNYLLYRYVIFVEDNRSPLHWIRHNLMPRSSKGEA